MFHMTNDEIAAQLSYCTIFFKSGVHPDFSSPEEMFAVIEAGKVRGKTAVESLQGLRYRNGMVVEIHEEKPELQDEAAPAPKIIAETGIVAAVVETVKNAAANQDIAKTTVAAGLTQDEQEDVDTYVSWIEQAKDMNTIDKILYRLKFEEDRENVKAAVRPVFKEKMKRLEREEAELRGAVQHSTATFRTGAANAANDNQDLESVSQPATGDERKNPENVAEAEHQRARVQKPNGSDEGQAVDNSKLDTAKDIGVVLDEIIAVDITTMRYDITASEKKHMVAKILGCSSVDELLAAAGSIHKYYIKNTSTDVMPLLDKLCTEKLKHMNNSQGRA